MHEHVPPPTLRRPAAQTIAEVEVTTLVGAEVGETVVVAIVVVACPPVCVESVDAVFVDNEPAVVLAVFVVAIGEPGRQAR